MKLILFILIMGIALGCFISGVYQRIRYVRLGRDENRSDQPLRRWKYWMRQIFLYERIREKPVFALMHFFLMWGFIILTVGTLDMASEGLFQVRIPFLGNNGVFLFLRDTFLLLGLVGVIGCILRRLIRKPGWLNNNLSIWLVLVYIALILISESLFYGVQFALGEVPRNIAGSLWFTSALGQGIQHLAWGEGSLELIKEACWWIHYLVMAIFLITLPRSKHLHLIFSFFNTYWHSLEAEGALSLSTCTEQGVCSMEDLTWKQLFDAFSCVKCGRCNGVCPSKLSGDKMKPKTLSGRLRKHVETKGPLLLKYGKNVETLPADVVGEKEKGILNKPLAGGVFEAQSIWDCTTCGACVQACPVSVEHLPKVIGMRTFLLSQEKDLPYPIKEMAGRIARRGTPWEEELYLGEGQWDLPLLRDMPEAEVVIYPGCAPYFNRRARDSFETMIKILRVAGIKAALLEKDYQCCGETMRRIGGERAYRNTVKENIARWQAEGLNSQSLLLTLCPHCFNTLKNEYPYFGGHFQVTGHLAYLAMLIREGRIVLKPPSDKQLKLTYQDPCYLARYNNVYDEAREIFKALPGIQLTEMAHNRKDGFCCGGGGGRFWLKGEAGKNTITRRRLTEAQSTEGEVICTACPYCEIVMERELGSRSQKISVLDIAEIVAQSQMEMPNVKALNSEDKGRVAKR